MKYCTKCGAQLNDDALYCSNCGNPVHKSEKAIYSDGNKDTTKSNDIFVTLAKVFMVLGCIINGSMIIPLAWCIPMTVSYWRRVDDGEEISVAFKICAILFVSTIGGIMMLFSKDD